MGKLTSITASLAIAAIMPLNVSAWDLKDVVSGLGNSKADTASTTDGEKSGIGGILGSLAGSLFSKDKLTIEDIGGTWKYKEPAISFKSENLLLKAGGAAATETVKKKIQPYYKAAGLEKLQIDIAEDSTFTMTVNRINLKGTINTDLPEGSEANFVFEFKAFGSVSLGNMDTYITRVGDNMNLMFDVTKLVQLIQKVAVLTGNNTAKGISSVLDQYDGVCAGFELVGIPNENENK